MSETAPPVTKPKILCLNGLPDDNGVKIVIRNNRREFVVMGSSNVFPTLQPFFDAHEVLLMGDAEDHPIRLGSRPELIFNQISDPDTHSISLSRAAAVCEQVRVPVINHPNQIARTRRDLICSALQGRPALIVPKTIRAQLTAPEQVRELAQQHGLQFPLLVRCAGAHGGHDLARLEGPDQVHPLHVLPMDGRHFYITEFLDHPGKDGLYRKCRLAFVDGRPLLIHWLAHEHWNVHTLMARDYVESKGGALADEEEHIFERFAGGWAEELRPIFDSITSGIDLDYFGVDGHVTEQGQLVVFEVNANMNMLPPPRQRPQKGHRIRRRAQLEAAIVELVNTRLSRFHIPH